LSRKKNKGLDSHEEKTQQEIRGEIEIGGQRENLFFGRSSSDSEKSAHEI
jgi:hypothetical protein